MWDVLEWFRSYQVDASPDDNGHSYFRTGHAETPSPLVGEGWGEGYKRQLVRQHLCHNIMGLTPPSYGVSPLQGFAVCFAFIEGLRIAAQCYEPSL